MPKEELTAMMMLTLAMVMNMAMVYVTEGSISGPDLRKVVESRHWSCKHPRCRPNRRPPTSLPYSVNLRKGVDLVARLLLVSDGVEHHLLVRQPSDSDPEQPHTTSEPESSHKDANPPAPPSIPMSSHRRSSLRS
ncbi:hypothetical protein Droror1_Dr00016305 [Drosera rotundifolia]